jgi:hypothetical protein
MIRYRWYQLLTKKEIQYILRKLNSLPFDYGEKKGFKLSYESSNSISGIFYYISMLSQDNANIDIVNAIQFSISKINDSIYLRIQDPTRSLKEFSNTLFQLCELDLAFEPIHISFNDIENWVLSRDYKAKLNLIKISNIEVKEGIFAEITLKSENELELSSIELLDGKKYKINLMSWSIMLSGKEYKVSISKTGLVKISEFIILDFINYVEHNIL